MVTLGRSALVLSCCVVLIVLALPAYGDGPEAGVGVCSRTATTLYQSCRIGVAADTRLGVAHCNEQVGADGRRDCLAENRSEAREEKDLCRDQREARIEVCDLLGDGQYLDPLLNPANVFVDPDEIGVSYPANSYLNLSVGHTYVLRAGEDFEETVVVYVTDQVREAPGFSGPVLCRVVIDVVLARETDDEGETEWIPVEVTDDYFAQDAEGNAYYCGEVVQNFEDGYLDNLDGSFFSSLNKAKAGVLLRQFPVAGQVDRQEYALTEAEDVVKYLELAAAPDEDQGGQNPNSPDFTCSEEMDGDCLKTLDLSALSPGDTEFKYYKKDLGFVLAVAIEDGEVTGEREELVCVGDSLAVLSEPACGLENSAELLDVLCTLAPTTLCE